MPRGPLRPASYWDYVRVDELLSLQGGREDDEARLTNDEVLFVVVHQVFELWFKLILRELRTARDLFRAERVAEQELSGAARSLARATTVLRIANQHWEVMETLTPRDFLEFRAKLIPASGFQSAQLRQLEILMGLPAEERIPLGLEGDYLARLRDAEGRASSSLRRVEAQLADRPTLREAIDEWLGRTPIEGRGPDDPGAEEALERFVGRYLAAHAEESARALELSLESLGASADRDELARRYEEERAQLTAFLSPGPEEGGAARRRIRVAALFLETYRELPLLAWPREVLEGLVELEQAFVVFRQRHARMVERIIGRRVGTGGSSGVDYLDRTALRYRVFRDLWAVRTFQIRRGAAPALERADFYGFVAGS